MKLRPGLNGMFELFFYATAKALAKKKRVVKAGKGVQKKLFDKAFRRDQLYTLNFDKFSWTKIYENGKEMRLLVFGGKH